ncbi:hypothetical protein H3309_02565 [Sandaracinobacteroides saxicola]|uniref:Uncharacterized protein n=2 Tax=Sandaracinobacteroides saxicola TaxID=2759707 RepID=A0A7G5IMA1_9SPHN|nr:hypothetical protein H3309_02565 [Sandaracinobacteroides saxicola]
MRYRIGLVAMVGALLAQPALAQKKQDPEDKAADIVAQPVRDLGLDEKKVAEVLTKARDNPYSRAGLSSCKSYVNAVAELDAVLGPDFDRAKSSGKASEEDVAAGVAGGLVNGLIPFRGLIREVTGAASADRRALAAAMAGATRRGFLKGTARAKGCKI